MDIAALLLLVAITFEMLLSNAKMEAGKSTVEGRRLANEEMTNIGDAFDVLVKRVLHTQPYSPSSRSFCDHLSKTCPAFVSRLREIREWRLRRRRAEERESAKGDHLPDIGTYFDSAIPYLNRGHGMLLEVLLVALG